MTAGEHLAISHEIHHLVCSLDIYSILKKNSGKCLNQELALDLSCSDHKNGHSSETVSY